MTKYKIVEVIGDGRGVYADSASEVADAVRPWFNDAPEDARETVDALLTDLDPTKPECDNAEVGLGVKVQPVD